MKLLQIGSTALAIMVLMAGSAMADLVATVDRTIVSDQDLVTLTVRASNETADVEPDFSALNRDFEVVSISPRSNSSLSIINGKTTSVVYKDYVIALAPRRLGNLTIPSIQAGRETTQPIPVRVQQQTASQRQRMNQFVFFETTVDTNETYVQGQIIYAVKLFYTEAIGGDFPQPPALPDTVVETIENEKRYESIVEGKRFYVLEKRYAIFPQRSGQIVIPRERFQGTRGRGGMFSRKQAVNAQSGSHTINVKPVPASFSGDVWIPAKALGIKESWAENPPTFRVGEPVNRTIALSAIGLSNALLPSMAEMDIEHAKVYADPPTSENRVGPDGLTALQVTTMGIVPTQAGELRLPEIRIPWWNTQTNREEVATIPAAIYQVLPALGESVSVPTVTVPVTELTQPTIVADPYARYWQWAAIGFAVLWLMFLWQWLIARRRIRSLESAAATSRFNTATFDDPDESREYKALKQACQRNRASDAHRQLFLWAKSRFPDLGSLAQLGQNRPELAAEIESLEFHLYAGEDSSTWRGAGLIGQVDAVRKEKVAVQAKVALETELNPT